MPDENTFKYATVWPKLTHDEKRLLLVMGAIYPLKDAVKHIGRDRKWLYKIRQKTHVRQAIESRNHLNTNEILNLMLNNMAETALVQLDRYLQSEELSKQDLEAFLRNMGRFNNNENGKFSKNKMRMIKSTRSPLKI